MDNNEMELTQLKKEIDDLIRRSNILLQTYRAIDALNVLQQALSLVETNNVQWYIKAAIFRNMGQAYDQQGQINDAMRFYIRSYEIIEDDNDKAAAASFIAGIYLRNNQLKEALDYANKALDAATAPELKSAPYQIKGGISAINGDYHKAIELLNKAAELAEQSHCITDLSMIIMDLSAIFLKMGKIETALSEIYRAERYVKECHCLELYMRCAVRRAHILYMMGKDTEAKKLIISLDEQKN